MPRAIEEVLRYASPVWRLVRTTRQEVTLAGVTIPKDEVIFTWLASANRDPRLFAEPERFLHHTHTEPACSVRTRHAFLYRCASFAHGGRGRVADDHQAIAQPARHTR